ncbi:MAG TPA: sugar transferase [Candidatus Eisenbacteria bacterium]|nr:sugar transferase [Candidatus Eisenbacteria bacterium]
MPEANELNTALSVVLTDPPHELAEGELDPTRIESEHNGKGNGSGDGAYPHTNGNGNGKLTNGHVAYANGATITVNGNGNGSAVHTHVNGNANGHARTTLGRTGYPGVLERNGNHTAAAAGNGAYARLAVLDAPGDLPVALPWLGAGEANPSSTYLRYGKRALDILVSSLGLALLSPFFLLLALLIKIDSRGPVFYKSKRLGRNGRPFTFYKFRSMYVGAHEDRHKVEHLNEKTDGPVFKISSDPRTTRMGRFIRQTSLDELPQLANVLCGQMTLVGPRPPLPEEVAQYQSWHRRRLEVKPGITCLWQISGRSRLGFNEWMRLDLEYIKRQSLATDLKILLRTLPAVVSREGAY